MVSKYKENPIFSLEMHHVLDLAQEEARRLNHNYVGTEHFLLGLAGMPVDDLAHQVLINLGVETIKVRRSIEFMIGRGDRAIIGEIGLTPRAKKVIELAVDETRRLNHQKVLPCHLLLGLVRENEGLSAGVLESLGVNLERVRTEVMRMMVLSQPQDKTAPETVPPMLPISLRVNDVLSGLPLLERRKLTRVIGEILDLAGN